MTTCSARQHFESDGSSTPCDFRLVEAAELQHGLSIALTFHYGHFDVEATAERYRGGVIFHPTVDMEWFTEEDTEIDACTAFEEMKTKWACATRAEIDAECFPDAGDES